MGLAFLSNDEFLGGLPVQAGPLIANNAQIPYNKVRILQQGKDL